MKYDKYDFEMVCEKKTSNKEYKIYYRPGVGEYVIIDSCDRFLPIVEEDFNELVELYNKIKEKIKKKGL